MDLNILRLNIFSHFEKENGSIQIKIFTPRYITLLERYHLLPHNSILIRWSSSFYCLDLKITISVFFYNGSIFLDLTKQLDVFGSAWTSLWDMFNNNFCFCQNCYINQLHNVQWGINPPSKAPPPSFLPNPP